MSYGPSSAHWLAKKPPGQWQQNEIYYVILSKLRIQGPKAYLHSLPHKSLLPIPTIIHVCSSGSWRGLKFIATPERGMTQWYVHKLDFTPLLSLRPTRFLQLGSNDPYGLITTDLENRKKQHPDPSRHHTVHPAFLLWANDNIYPVPSMSS